MRCNLTFGENTEPLCPQGGRGERRKRARACGTYHVEVVCVDGELAGYRIGGVHKGVSSAYLGIAGREDIRTSAPT
jgi:hypothetical protein